MNTSPNTPILLKILDRLDKLETSVDILNKSVNTLNKSFHILDESFHTLDESFHTLDESFHAYTKRESDIQEYHTTRSVKRLLQEQFPFAKIHISPLKNFYIPTSIEIYTDIDGCIILESPPVLVKNTKGASKELIQKQVYIIEAKHGLTKTMIDKKLKQFCTMYDILKGIQTGLVLIPDPPVTRFDNMVISYNLHEFPEDVHFVFASDDITEEDYLFLSSIANGTLTESLYNSYLMKYLKSHKIITDILDDIDVNKLIKNIVKNATSINEIYSLFVKTELPRNASKFSKAVESQKDSVAKYKDSILNLLIPFSNMNPCYESLKGRLKVYSSYELSYILSSNLSLG